LTFNISDSLICFSSLLLRPSGRGTQSRWLRE